MTQHLREALHDFAERADAPWASPGAAPNARDLWQRGRSARRQRVAASVVVVGAVLALLGAVVPVVGDQLRTTPVPASYDEADLAVPDDIRPPSSWGPSASENDPPGPLAVVGSAPRRGIWPFSQDQQWFGVSAVDQSATWLDLPGQSEDDRRIALSPDGSRLAYFLHGTPPGPRGEVADPSYLADGPQSDVVGFAVLDLVTGEVTERELETRFGIRSQALAWSGDSQWLLADPAQYMRMLGGSRVANVEAWRPSTGR